ncbi:uncharacterized protein LOC126566774 [Anopheles maculipalpis]|uniref:uncharacterized protein LOC126566774 n=1 Tax=Anopheles maculipalpis TaxID=1496333 RepID=UPI002159101B|nr:uncharacterized protein LOC126566774 [Anopheles maculipalpis]
MSSKNIPADKVILFRFRKNFPVSKEIFLDILNEIEPKFPPVRVKGLTPKEVLAATLRFLAEGSYQNGTGKDFNIAIAQPTFSVALTRCLNILEETLAPKYISLSMELNEQQDCTVPSICLRKLHLCPHNLNIKHS